MRFSSFSIRKRPDDCWEVYCDAGFKYGKGVSNAAAAAIDISHGEKKYRRKIRQFRAQGPVHAELMAVYHSLRVIDRLKGERKNVVIHTDNQYVYDCLEFGLNAVRDYIVDARDRILSLRQNFAYFEVVKVTSKGCKEIRSVDRAAFKARKREEKKIKRVKDRKLDNIQKAIKRARSEGISILEQDNSFYAESASNPARRYKVSLKPLHCECPAFSARWSQVPVAGKIRNRMPCKHLCALADFLGEDIHAYIKIKA